MTKEEFENIVEEVLERLPDKFFNKIDNVHIVVEEYPGNEHTKRKGSENNSLLGLYQGIPLVNRGSWYGAFPTVPDKITLFQRNIEAACSTREEICERIYEVLLHELGHYYGMSETEIRKALNNFKLFY